MPTSGEIGTSLKLDFDTATIVQNNLGGYGPDNGAEELRFDGVGSKGDQDVNLVVTAVSGYVAFNTESTFLNGQFGQINLLKGQEALLSFCFEDASTGEAVIADEFTLSLHDFDDAATKTDPRVTYGVERLVAAGMTQYKVSTSFDPPVATQLDITEFSDGSVQFAGTEAGVGGDNAQDPNDLTDLQKARMVELEFKDKSCFQLTFAVDEVEEGRSDCMQLRSSIHRPADQICSASA